MGLTGLHDKVTIPGWPHLTPARPEEQAAAFALALRHVPEPERSTCVSNALSLLSAGELEGDGILVARSAAGILGVQVCVPLKGGGGLCWIPQVVDEFASSDLAVELVRAGIAWLQARGTCFAQALIARDAHATAAPLLRAGFVHITEVLYLQHPLTELPELESCPRLVAYSSATQRQFEDTLDESYHEALDCPELNGLRPVQDVIEGHKAQGHWSPERWRLALIEGKPAAVVLLTELPGGDGWDLSYLGVVPRFRGQGLGRRLALWALHEARTAGALQMLVAVDARNAPARRLYENLGFRGTGARDVFLCIFAADEGKPTETRLRQERT